MMRQETDHLEAAFFLLLPASLSSHFLSLLLFLTFDRFAARVETQVDQSWIQNKTRIPLWTCFTDGAATLRLDHVKEGTVHHFALIPV